MSIKYTELIGELRSLADGTVNPYYIKKLTEAADAIETLSGSIKAYSDAAFERAVECNELKKRIDEYEQADRRDAAAVQAAEAAAMYAEQDKAAPVWIASRKSILEDAEKCVCGHREEDYGSPEDSFATIAELWTTYSGHLFTAVDVAMMMALLKIARIAGGRGSEDSFVDLAGYAACGGEIWSKREAERAENAKVDSLPRYSSELWNEIKKNFERSMKRPLGVEEV